MPGPPRGADGWKDGSAESDVSLKDQEHEDDVKDSQEGCQEQAAEWHKREPGVRGHPEGYEDCGDVDSQLPRA